MALGMRKGWLNRVGRSVVSLASTAWRVGVEDTASEIKRYRAWAWNYWSGPKKSGGAGAMDVLRRLVLAPVLGLQLLLLTVVSVVVLVMQSLRFAVWGLFWLLVNAPRGIVGAAAAVSRRSWKELTAGAVVLVLGLGAGLMLLRHRADAAARKDLYTKYWQALQRGDRDAAEKELVRLLDVAPADELERVRSRLQAHREGVADEGDIDFLRLTTFENFRKGRLADAAAEAAKLVRLDGRDWPARTILAAKALNDKDRAEASRHLAELPDARDVAVRMPTLWLRMAAEISNQLGERKRADQILEAIVLNRMPAVAARAGETLPPAEALELVDLYQRTVLHLQFRADLALSWAPAQRLARSVVESSVVEFNQLLRIGVVQEANLNLVAEFRRRDVRGFAMPEEQKERTAEVEENLTAVWAKVIEKNPTHFMGYLGQASQLFRVGKVEEAVARLDEGLKTVAEKTPLTTAKARFLRLARRPTDEKKFLEEMLADAPKSLELLSLKAESALASKNLEDALWAARQAAAIQKDLYWARRLEAEACLKLKRPDEAWIAVQAIRPQLMRDPSGVGLTVLSAASAGQMAEVADVMEKFENDKAPAVLSIAGIRALGEAGAPAEAVKWAERLVAREPENIPARMLLADGLRGLVENGPLPWNKDLAARAAEQYLVLARKTKDNPVFVNNAVWLLIRGVGDKEQAFKASETLRPFAERTDAPPEILDTLGALYNMTGDHAAARRLLERTLGAKPPRVSYHLNLAEALLGLGLADEAEQQLEKALALRLPMTPRETADLKALSARAARTKP